MTWLEIWLSVCCAVLAFVVACAFVGWQRALTLCRRTNDEWAASIEQLTATAVAIAAAERERCAEIAEQPEPVPDCYCRWGCQCDARESMDPQKRGERIARRIREG